MKTKSESMIASACEGLPSVRGSINAIVATAMFAGASSEAAAAYVNTDKEAPLPYGYLEKATEQNGNPINKAGVSITNATEIARICDFPLPESFFQTGDVPEEWKAARDETCGYETGRPIETKMAEAVAQSAAAEKVVQLVKKAFTGKRTLKATASETALALYDLSEKLNGAEAKAQALDVATFFDQIAQTGGGYIIQADRTAMKNTVASLINEQGDAPRHARFASIGMSSATEKLGGTYGLSMAQSASGDTLPNKKEADTPIIVTPSISHNNAGIRAGVSVGAELDSDTGVGGAIEWGPKQKRAIAQLAQKLDELGMWGDRAKLGIFYDETERTYRIGGADHKRDIATMGAFLNLVKEMKKEQEKAYGDAGLLDSLENIISTIEINAIASRTGKAEINHGGQTGGGVGATHLEMSAKLSSQVSDELSLAMSAGARHGSYDNISHADSTNTTIYGGLGVSYIIADETNIGGGIKLGTDGEKSIAAEMQTGAFRIAVDHALNGDTVTRAEYRIPLGGINKRNMNNAFADEIAQQQAAMNFAGGTLPTKPAEGDMAAMAASVPTAASAAIDSHAAAAHAASQADNKGSENAELVDSTAPEVAGVADDTAYFAAVTPTFTEGTATIEKDGGGTSAFTSGTNISAAGLYQLKVTDNSGNVNTVDFEILSFTAGALEDNKANSTVGTLNITSAYIDASKLSVDIVAGGASAGSFSATHADGTISMDTTGINTGFGANTYDIKYDGSSIGNGTLVNNE